MQFNTVCIEPKEEGGLITLSIEQIDGMIQLKIADTGEGIPQDMIKEILGSDDRILSDQSTGIGISNVKRSLNIAFQGKGTTIILTIPGEASV